MFEREFSTPLNAPELDFSAWLAALEAAPHANPSEEAILNWLSGPLRRFFFFEKSIAYYGGLSIGRVETKRIIAWNYPQAFLDEFEGAFDMEKRGCVRWWLLNAKPILYDPAAPPEFATQNEIDEIERHSLGVIGVHGVIDPVTGCGSFHSFSGVSRSDPHLFRKLEMIAPVLHALLLASMGRIRSKLQEVSLTPRQIEIARLAAKGMDDKTIARALRITDHAVAHHLRGIYGRLGVRRRCELANALN